MMDNKIADSLRTIKLSDPSDNRLIAAILEENHREQEGKIRKMEPRKRTLVLTVFAVLAVTLAIGAGASGSFGRLFDLVTRNDSSDDYNGGNLSLIAERMKPVRNEVAKTQMGNLTLSIREAYYDGMTLYCVGEIETDLDPNAKQTDWNFDISVNGVPLDFDYSLRSRDWIKTEDGTYINDSLSVRVPAELRPQDPNGIRVKYTATHYSYEKEENNRGTGELEKASAEFMVSCTDETVSISAPAEQNGVKFLYLCASPATTEICMDVPKGLAGYDPTILSSIALTTEDGKPITLNSSENCESRENPNSCWQLTYSGEAVPQGVSRLIATLWTSDASNRHSTATASFQIDLEKESVTPLDR